MGVGCWGRRLPGFTQAAKVEVRSELHYDVTCAPLDRILIGGGAGKLRRAPIRRYTCGCMDPPTALYQWRVTSDVYVGQLTRCPQHSTAHMRAEAWPYTYSVTEEAVIAESVNVYTSLSSTSSYTQYITNHQQHPHTCHKAHPPPAQGTSSTSRTCAPWAAAPSPCPSRPRPRTPPRKPMPPPEPRC